MPNDGAAKKKEFGTELVTSVALDFALILLYNARLRIENGGHGTASIGNGDEL